MFPAGKKDASDAVEYDGGRTSDAIVAWALEKVAENVPPPDVFEVSLHPQTTSHVPQFVPLYVRTCVSWHSKELNDLVRTKLLAVTSTFGHSFLIDWHTTDRRDVFPFHYRLE